MSRAERRRRERAEAKKVPGGPEPDPRILGAVQMIERTGASTFQLRYHDDEQPLVWMAVATYEGKGAEVAAALDPLGAVLRLCETLIDGGTCVHCKRPTGFTEDHDAMPLGEHVCWYQWDPELRTFRRGCEGDGA